MRLHAPDRSPRRRDPAVTRPIGARNSRADRVFVSKMSRIHPLALAATLIVMLAAPSAASAEIVEIGKAAEPGASSCPENCFAVSRTTGYQAKVGTSRGLMTVPTDGYIVAWTISLGKPGRKQTEFFERRLGGVSEAYITVLQPNTKLRSRVVAHGTARKLERFFGTSVQFPLPRALRVKKGMVIALTVPTWAPALAVGLGGDTSWRASRGKGQCDDSGQQTAQTEVKKLTQYYCLYRTARLAYSATLVTSPYAKDTSKTKRSTSSSSRRR